MERGEFGGDFRFESEAVLLEVERLKHFAPEHLVTRFHVGQVQVREHVRQQSEQAVSERMPKGKDAMAFAADEPRAVHDIGSSVENRLKQPGILGGVVFQISILYED